MTNLFKKENKKKENVIYTNGYSDGSGEGTIVRKINGEEEAILRTHWGCSCCDRETNQEDIKLANKIVEILNKNKTKLK